MPQEAATGDRHPFGEMRGVEVAQGLDEIRLRLAGQPVGQVGAPAGGVLDLPVPAVARADVHRDERDSLVQRGGGDHHGAPAAAGRARQRFQSALPRLSAKSSQRR